MLASPSPKKKVTESDIDEVLAQIDVGLRKVHRKVKTASSLNINGDTPCPAPTRAFSPAKMKRTKMEFQAMSEDSLLTDSGDDITLAEVEAKLLAKSGVMSTDADAR